MGLAVRLPVFSLEWWLRYKVYVVGPEYVCQDGTEILVWCCGSCSTFANIVIELVVFVRSTVDGASLWRSKGARRVQ